MYDASSEARKRIGAICSSSVAYRPRNVDVVTCSTASAIQACSCALSPSALRGTRRGGALARLGHDHVIASRTLQGVVTPAPGRAQFQFRLDQMSVDEEGLRQAAGLTTTPSADAIAGTRHNMLVRVLDAERYPWVSIEARRTGDNEVFEADITLHGVTRTVQLPVRVEQAADGRGLQASGSLLLKQSDFGIVPFAILGGAMAVQDQMELAFRITARQDLSAPGSGASPGR